MEIKNKTHPWYHSYYSQIKDMYHPFLYHNHLYCELPQEYLKQLLAERDSYIKVSLRIIDIHLTDAEHDWIFYLRDCCLFELHRRKYKIVLTELVQFTNTKNASHADWPLRPLTPHSKVMEWLDKTETLYETGDFRRARDEYPKQLEQDIYPDSRDLTISSGLDEDKFLNVDFNIEFIKYPPVEKSTEQRIKKENNKKSKNTNQKTVKKMVGERRIVKSTGDLSDQDMNYNIDTEEVKLINEKLERLRKAFQSQKKEKELIQEEKDKEGFIKESGGLENLIKSTTEINRLTPDYIRSAISTAINTDYSEPKDFPELNIPLAEMGKAPDGSLLMIDVTTLGEAIRLMNIDTYIRYGDFMKRKRSELTCCATSTSGGGYYLDDVPFYEPPEDCSALKVNSTGRLVPRETALDSDKIGDGYIQPGTYTVPKDSSTDHIKKDGFQPITVPEEPEHTVEEDPGKRIIKQLYPNLLPEYCEASTSYGPLPVSEFHQVVVDDDDTLSTLSYPSVIHTNRTQNYFEDKDFNSITSEDIRQFDEEMKKHGLDCTIADTEPPEELFAPSPPAMSPDELDKESTISDSDIIGRDENPEVPKQKLKKD